MKRKSRLEMRLICDMVYFDKSTIQKLQAQIADVQKSYKGSISRNTVQNALQRLEDKAKDASNDNRSIFQSAFCNLEDHVMEVQSNGRHKQHRGNLQKPHSFTKVVQVLDSVSMPSLPSGKNPGSQSWPDSLCSSLQVFQIHKWRPLTPNHKRNIFLTPRSACERTRSRLETTCLNLQQKRVSEFQDKCILNDFPGSLTPFVRRQEARAESKNFDIISSRIHSHLAIDHRPLSSKSDYCGVIEQNSRKAILSKESEERITSLNCDLSSTSGIDSDGGKSETDEEYYYDVGEENDNDSISDLENAKKPITDYLIQQPNLHLRPELIDQVITDESKPDINSFDFNDNGPEEPVYQFKCPLPAPLEKISLQQCAKEKSDWRHGNAPLGSLDPVLCAMIDRLVELEKMQIETLNWEERRIRLLRKRPVSHSNKPRDTCLQAVDLIECQNKRIETNYNDKSHQPICADLSKDVRNDHSVLQSCEELKIPGHSRTAEAQVHNSSQKQRITRGLVTNRKLLGRPKSAFCSIRRGKSAAISKDLRPVSASNVPVSLSKATENLLLESDQATSLSKDTQPQSSKKGDLLPKKSYYFSTTRSQKDLFSKRRSSVKITKIKRQILN